MSPASKMEWNRNAELYFLFLLFYMLLIFMCTGPHAAGTVCGPSLYQ